MTCYDRSNKGAGFFLCSVERIEFIMAGKAWWLECEVVGHTIHTGRRVWIGSGAGLENMKVSLQSSN